MKPKSILRSFLALAGSSLLALSSAHAADRTWDGDTSNLWGAAANWDALPGSTDYAVFNLAGPYGASSTPRSPSVGSAATVFGIKIGASNGTMTLTTNSNLSIGITSGGSAGSGGITIDNGAGAFTISGGLTINYSPIFTNNSANTFTFGALSAGTGDKWLDFRGSGNMIGTGVISGFGNGVVTVGVSGVSGPKVTLNGVNTYGAKTLVNSGTLAVTGGGQLYNTANKEIANAVTINSGGTVEFDNWLWQGSFGTLNYASANIVINGGTLKYVGTTANGSNSRGLTIGASGATLESATSLQKWVVTSGTGYTTLVSSGGTLTLTGAGDGQIDKVIPGTGGLTKSGNGTWTLAGTNTYTGTTTATAGVLVATKAAALPGYNAADKVIFNGGAVAVQVGGSGWTTTQVDTLLTKATKTSGALGIDTTNGSLTQWTAFTTTNLGSTLGLAKLGTNTLTLDLANNYAGATTVTAGTLQIGNAGTTGSLTGTSSITVGTGSNLTINRSDAFTQATDLNNKAITGAGSFTQAGGGTTTLSLTNTYTGATAINQGTLKLGDNDVLPDASPVSIGTATLDADTRTDTVGTLNVTGSAVINLGSGAALVFADSSAGGTATWAGTLNITGTLGATSLKFGNGSSGLSPAQLTKISVNGSGLGTYTLDASGYLIPVGPDTTPPTLTSITDDKSGGPVTVGTLVTYTVTFSEDIDSASVDSTVFDNNGTAGITIGTITETTPTSGIFTVQVTPTSSGSLNLRIPTGAVVKDVAGNNLVVPVADDTTITVNPSDPYLAWAGSGVLFDADANGDGVSNGLAWLLGASGPNAAVTLPTTSQTGGNLVMSFTCLATANRGTATLTLEYDGDLAGTWLSVPVPGAVGNPNPIVETTTTGSVSFVATDGGTNANGAALINVVATISDATESTSGKLFGRLKAVTP